VSLNMQNEIPLKYDSSHSGKTFALSQKLVSLPERNRKMNQRHIQINNLEFKNN